MKDYEELGVWACYSGSNWFLAAASNSCSETNGGNGEVNKDKVNTRVSILTELDLSVELSFAIPSSHNSTINV